MNTLPLWAQIVIAVFLGINLVALIEMGRDKANARAGRTRTPEARLWTMALLGGSAGVLLGMKLFRHKTRKPSFQLVLVLVVALQIALLLGAAWWGGIVTV